ncbi:DUF6174 domain-containing protein [Streptomyces sp. NPDC059866]|uniref:DUF6174 domain-containing protein n=1 Tax=Streptomyces sp. NPDC059866 TaxID=3346978 RepID=UPI003659AAA9
MTAVRRTPRFVPAVVLIGGVMSATAACGTGSSSSAEVSGTKPASAHSTAAWEEPDSYTYTLQSTEGERTLLGAFRVTVRDGKVAEAVGLDDSGRRVVRQAPAEVPTLRELLGQLEQARRDGADTAEAEYAADGHPVRISLDWEKNAIDDEALYVITAYEPRTR